MGVGVRQKSQTLTSGGGDAYFALKRLCAIADLGILKDVKVALCGLKNIDLTKECIKILGVHIS